MKRNEENSIAIEREVCDPVIGDHICLCHNCQRNKEVLLMLREFAVSEGLFDAPQAALEEAIRIFRSREPSASAIQKDILLKLVYDSTNEQQPTPGARRRHQTARQVLYEGDGLQLDLRVQLTEDNGGFIAGQLISERMVLSLDSLEIALCHGRIIIASRTNGRGEFVFDNLVEGEYELKLQVGENLVRLPGVTVR